MRKKSHKQKKIEYSSTASNIKLLIHIFIQEKIKRKRFSSLVKYTILNYFAPTFNQTDAIKRYAEKFHPKHARKQLQFVRHKSFLKIEQKKKKNLLLIRG